MKINTLTTDKNSLKVGEDILFEVCMENTGDFGDIVLYAGFGYKQIGQPITFIGDGDGYGYLYQDIANVIVGEKMCPYGVVTLTQEVIDVANTGKDIRLFAYASPGGEANKLIEITTKTVETTEYIKVLVLAALGGYLLATIRK